MSTTTAPAVYPYQAHAWREGAKTVCISRCDNGQWIGREVPLAAARAAEDLLTAIKRLLAQDECQRATYSNNIRMAEAVDLAQAAVAKAEGRS